MNALQEKEFEILKQFDTICKEHGIQYVLYAGTLLGAIRHKGFIPWDDDIDIAMTRPEYEKFEKIFDHQFGLRLQSDTRLPYYYHAHAKLRNNSMEIYEDVSRTQRDQKGPWIDLFIYDNIPDKQIDRVNHFLEVNKVNEKIRKKLFLKANEIDKGLKYVVKKVLQTYNELFHRFFFTLPKLFKKRTELLTKYNDQETKELGIASFYNTYDYYQTTFMKKESFTNITTAIFEGEEFPVPANYDECLTVMYGDYMKIPEEHEQVTHNIRLPFN